MGCTELESFDDLFEEKLKEVEEFVMNDVLIKAGRVKRPKNNFINKLLEKKGLKLVKVRYLEKLKKMHSIETSKASQASKLLFGAVFNGVLFHLAKNKKPFVESCELFEKEAQPLYVKLVEFLALAELLKFMAPSVLADLFSFCYIPSISLEKHGIKELGPGRYAQLFDVKGLFRIENVPDLMKEIFVCEPYKNEPFDIKPADNTAFLDLGAGFGETALWYSLYASNSALLAIDASDDAVKVMKRNYELAKNFLRSRGNEFIIVKKYIKDERDVNEIVSTFRDYNAFFLKTDIEGYERGVLPAFKGFMKEHKPLLAISAYHRWDDLVTLPKLIKESNPSYKLYLKPSVAFYRVPHGPSFCVFGK